MHGWRLVFAILFLLTAAATCLAPLPARAQAENGRTFGAWNMICEKPPGAPGEQCGLNQNVIAEDRPNVALSILVFHTADKSQTIMQVLVPLGVLLPKLLWLRLDGELINKYEYVRCLPNGCVAVIAIDDNLAERLKKGGTALFIIYETKEAGIGIPVNLSGFSEGFLALK